MSGKHRIVLVNGAPGVGKSWLVKQIADWRQKHHLPSASVGFNDGLKKAVGAIVGLDLFNEAVYASFKTQVFVNGQTGREFMIMVSEGSKAFKPDIWVDRFIDRVTSNYSTKVLILCDSFGFPVEFHRLLADESTDTLNVYIDDGNGHTYAGIIEGDYRQFRGDSRVDLSRHCSIRAPDSSVAFEMVKTALLNRGW